MGILILLERGDGKKGCGNMEKLSPKLEVKLQTFFKNREVEYQLRDRIRQIVEMASSGANNREIIKTVDGDTTLTGEYLMRLRRDGVV